MNYTKPEVAVLGDAIRVIETRTAKGNIKPGDGVPFLVLNAAYDLDE